MLWVKALHIIAVVSWFAGLFYLPRLFVYHADCEDEVGRKRFTLMERRLYKQIMNPAMMVTFILGLSLLAWFPVGGWVVAKFVLVLVLIGFHVWCGRQINRLENGHGLSAKTYRLVNEIPTVLLIAIVFLVVLKPF